MDSIGLSEGKKGGGDKAGLRFFTHENCGNVIMFYTLT